MPGVSVVVLAWREEPLLAECVHAILASRGVAADVVLVDNGCTDDGVESLRGTPGVTVVEPGDNLGFAGGCNRGAREATGEFLAFVNGDAVVEPDALAALVAVLGGPDDPGDPGGPTGPGSDVGLATASVRLHEQPEVVNTTGNPVHFTGLSWAGGMGQPATDFAHGRDVASASGAATACRRDRFEALGGFYEEMFAYCEDTDLSLRCWLRGWRVVYVPDAVVTHRYEFSRNPSKFYLLARNRLLMVLTVYGATTLALVAPVLLALELASLAVAARDGWARHQLRAWWWLARHTRHIAVRRREVQATRRVPERRLAAVLTGDLDPRVPGLSVPPLARRVLVAYWGVARRLT